MNVHGQSQDTIPFNLDYDLCTCSSVRACDIGFHISQNHVLGAVDIIFWQEKTMLHKRLNFATKQNPYRLFWITCTNYESIVQRVTRKRETKENGFALIRMRSNMDYCELLILRIKSWCGVYFYQNHSSSGSKR